MKYKNITHAKFIERRNRFIAHVELAGNIEAVHVKNTGRLKELLLPGSNVVLAKSGNPTRKTQYDLIAVYKDGLGWVNIDARQIRWSRNGWNAGTVQNTRLNQNVARTFI